MPINKYYDDANYNAAFERCVDVMSRMIQKYGYLVLKEIEQDDSSEKSCAKKEAKMQSYINKAA